MASALWVYAGLSAIAFVAYGWDKWLARRGGRRIPETQLHALALAGGFLGAWLGMRAFRHKTQKPVFAVVLLAAAALHVAGWFWVRPWAG